ncbi:MAG: CoA transferase [Rhodospirillales bacterium]|nr:CoA transferase [Rhodospirillales bacterium]
MTAGSALAGLRVLDISRVLAGPSCGQLLADMGADVIKVEPPDGDENRRWPPFVASGASCNFDSVNRGKRNLAVDLKHPNGQRIVHGLADRADVLLLSFLPQTAAKLGLDPAVLTARNPRLVVCEVTGYGAAGPMAERPGYDLMMQAFAGAMSMTGLEGEPPVRTGLSFIDMATGLAAYGAVLTALMARATTGRGTVVRTSLLETGISLLGYHAVAWLAAGVMPKRAGLPVRRRVRAGRRAERGRVATTVRGAGPAGARGRSTLHDQCRPGDAPGCADPAVVGPLRRTRGGALGGAAGGAPRRGLPDQPHRPGADPSAGAGQRDRR